MIVGVILLLIAIIAFVFEFSFVHQSRKVNGRITQLIGNMLGVRIDYKDPFDLTDQTFSSNFVINNNKLGAEVPIRVALNNNKRTCVIDHWLRLYLMTVFLSAAGIILIIGDLTQVLFIDQDSLMLNCLSTILLIIALVTIAYGMGQLMNKNISVPVKSYILFNIGSTISLITLMTIGFLIMTDEIKSLIMGTGLITIGIFGVLIQFYFLNKFSYERFLRGKKSIDE